MTLAANVNHSLLNDLWLANVLTAQDMKVKLFNDFQGLCLFSKIFQA